jgi:ribosome-associated toxin RatA of RatAB toxin-antitoxin module
MDLFYNLVNINKHIFHFIRKKNTHDNNIITNNTYHNEITADVNINYDKISNIYIDKLTKLSVELEDIYYHNLLFPKLQNIWNVENNTYLACISCIIHVIGIMSDHKF